MYTLRVAMETVTRLKAHVLLSAERQESKGDRTVDRRLYADGGTCESPIPCRVFCVAGRQIV